MRIQAVQVGRLPALRSIEEAGYHTYLRAAVRPLNSNAIWKCIFSPLSNLLQPRRLPGERGSQPAAG